MREVIVIAIILLLVQAQKSPDQFNINLDLAPHLRYKQVSFIKKPNINKFIDFLHTNQKYKIAFKTSKLLLPFLRQIVGAQFFSQCLGIAQTIGRHVSELVVFNYMYQLGAYNDFCTSIAVQNGPNDYFLARNLDYGFQEFLADNSVHLTYYKNNIPIFQTIGHAGLIGAHTALRMNGYAITLNERIDGGLHKTLEEIFLHRSETVPYLLQKTLRKAATINQAQYLLLSTRVCAAVYYILNSDGRNIVIQKQRIGAKAVYENNLFIVQTNTDKELPDPDSRRDVAETKMKKIRGQSKLFQRQKVWKILTESPNMNKLTLITVLLDVSRNQVNATIWV